MSAENAPRVRSYVADRGGAPTLFVNGAPFPAAAYMTYLREYNDWASFADAGYRLFSVPVLCAGRWINAAAAGRPFHRGIFDDKDAPDYTALDGAVRALLAVCPDAYVFPRVNLAAPLWWIAENPACTDGSGARELLFSDRYRAFAASMLRAVIRHILASDYAGRVAGLQLAGGNTEEWFHFDLNGGYCENAAPFFSAYLQKRGCEDAGLPDLAPLGGAGPFHNDALVSRYLEFANESVAELICALCAVAREETGGALAVGTFYGYALEVSSPLWGTHALRTLLACGDVDFICSPNSYIGGRDRDADWTEMYAADSVRLHGKLCMQECDVRTHLTRPLPEAAPEYDPEKRYNAPIWRGLGSREEAVSALRKTFCRQLVKGNGFWWFDMWGGWYRDPALMAELRRMREIYAASLQKETRVCAAQLAVFADEAAYRELTDCALRAAAFNVRVPLGRLGAPYDVYDVFDFDAVRGKYRAVVFAGGLSTPAARRAAALCEADGVPYLALSASRPQISSAALRAFCEAAGVHIWCRSDDLLYANGSFLALHAAGAGEKTVRLPGVYAWRALLPDDGAAGTADVLRVPMRANETRLFALTAPPTVSPGA